VGSPGLSVLTGRAGMRTIHEDDTAAGDGGRRTVVHVIDLQQQPHAAGQRDALIAGQREHLVVILWEVALRRGQLVWTKII
jgi:hypothetical protein